MFIYTKEINGFKVEIKNVCDANDNPRDWDNLGTMVLFHKRYDVVNETSLDHKDYKGWGELRSAITKTYGPSLIIPVYMYDHSGIALNTTGFECPWDSGQLGYIFITHSRICSEYGRKRVSKRLLDMISSFLNEEVKIYSQYINGEVYGYVISKDDEVVDSCFGFYGSDFDSNGLNDEINTIISRQR